MDSLSRAFGYGGGSPDPEKGPDSLLDRLKKILSGLHRIPASETPAAQQEIPADTLTGARLEDAQRDLYEGLRRTRTDDMIELTLIPI